MVQPVKLVAFVVVMIAYLWIPISTIRSQERILSKGEVFRFQPQLVDPYDAFRGKFIWLNLPAPEFDLDKTLRIENGQKVYAHLSRDSAGFAYYTGFTTDRPVGNTYIQTYVDYHSEERISLRAPESLRKYYLNEKLAPLAEKKYNELIRAGGGQQAMAKVVVAVRVFEGNALVEKVYFNDMEMEDYLRKENF